MSTEEETPVVPAEEPEASEPVSVEPELVAEPAVEESAACPPRPRSGIPWWPFLVYLAVWAAFIAVTVFVLGGPAVSDIPLENPTYPLLLVALVTLTACGPFLALLTWVVVWFRREPGCRSGLLTSALVRGAATTFSGALAWSVARVIVDAMRLGIL